jgi:peptidoglycan/LPS O-acetylase OafA/YrhL
VLDIWRIICASLVVISHAGQLGLFPAIGNSLMPASHHAVILFFVISGFSVAFSADKVDRRPGVFIAARLSRIFSVAVPAIIITLLVDVAAKSFNPQASDVWQLNRWFAYLLFALSFSGELWFTSIHPFSNIPFWSLNYELYYYLFFAALLIESRPVRIISASILLIAIGPKMLLLLPCWLCGVGLYQWLKKNTSGPQEKQAFGIPGTLIPWILFALIYAVLTISDFAQWANSLSTPYHPALQYSKDFIFDTVLALSFSVCLFLNWRRGANSLAETSWFTAWAHKLAPLTFAVYALHYPLLKFVAESPEKSNSLFINVLIVLLIFSLSAAIGLLLEPTRKYWQRAVLFILEKARG